MAKYRIINRYVGTEKIAESIESVLESVSSICQLESQAHQTYLEKVRRAVKVLTPGDSIVQPAFIVTCIEII